MHSTNGLLTMLGARSWGPKNAMLVDPGDGLRAAGCDRGRGSATVAGLHTLEKRAALAVQAIRVRIRRTVLRVPVPICLLAIGGRPLQLGIPSRHLSRA